MIIKMPCITCPMSCHLEVELNERKEVIHVTGNTCPRGEEYAKHELTHPVRMITTTIRITDAIHPLVPVMTTKPVPKEKIFDIIELCKKKVVKAPITQGDVIIEKPFGLDVNIIATRNLDEVEHDESSSATSHS